MDIDITPSEVLKSADSVDATARRLAQGAEPGHPGNDGFMTSAAISQFAAQMHQTSAQAATDTGGAAEKLEASARLMRRVDDDVESAHRALWSRLR
jgi:hypothetical protein